METELATFAVIIASISSFAVAGSFILNWRVKTEETNIRYIELITQFSNKIGEISREGYTLKTKTEFLDWSTKYIQKCELIAHLIGEGKIPTNITKFVEGNIQDAYLGMIWLDKKYSHGGMKLEEMARHLTEFVNTHPIDTKLQPQFCLIEGVYQMIDKKIDLDSKL